MSTVNRGEFLAALESCRPGLSTSSADVQQSSCFVLKNGRVRTFNGEVACSAPSGLEKALVCAVEGKPLTEMLAKMTEESVEMSLDDQGRLLVQGKRRSAKFNAEAEILLPLSAVDKPQEWTEIDEELSKAIDVVRWCSGKDETRFFVNCLHLHPDWVEARDAVQLCRWPLKTSLKEPCLVRQNAVSPMASMGMTHVGETENWVHFKNGGGLTYSCRRYVESYPDMSAQLKVKGEKVAFPKGLAEELVRAKVFTSEAETDRVLITLNPGKVTAVGKGVHGEYEARLKLRYDGPLLSFLVSPEMLAEIVKEHNECFVSQERLKVESGKYTYVCCLMAPESSVGGETDE